MSIMKRKPNPKLSPDAQLVSIDEATQQLGHGYSRRSILRRIDSGEWEEGFHWVDARRRGALRRVIKINLTAVRDELAIPAAFR